MDTRTNSALGVSPLRLEARASVYPEMAWFEGFVTAALVGPYPMLTDIATRMLPSSVYNNSGISPVEAQSMVSYRLDQIRKRLKRLADDFVPEFTEYAKDDAELLLLARSWAQGFEAGIDGDPTVAEVWRMATETFPALVPRLKTISIMAHTRGLPRDGQELSADEINRVQLALIDLVGPATRGIQLICKQIRHRSSARPAPAKVGRNDACPCGSGEKHKRC